MGKANPVAVPDLNWRCDVPADWTERHSGGYVMDVVDKSTQRRFYCMASPSHRSAEQAQLLVEAYHARIATHGYIVKGHRPVVIGQIPFEEIASVKTVGKQKMYRCNYLSAAGGSVYCMGMTKLGGKPGDDAALKAILASVSFMHPPPNPAPEAPSKPWVPLAKTRPAAAPAKPILQASSQPARSAVLPLD